MCETEVTQAQWAKVMGKTPSYYQSEKLGYRPNRFGLYDSAGQRLGVDGGLVRIRLLQNVQ